MKRKFIGPFVLLLGALFAFFALGFCLGNSQRGVIVSGGDTEALGLAPAVSKQKEIPLVDLNAATAEELAELPGIGEKLAETIVAFRTEHGAFTSFWELTAIEGIGEGKLNTILPYLSIS